MPKAVDGVEVRLDTISQIRVRDLVAMNNALQAYREANGTYPITPNGGFVVMTAGDWIPGLVPIFLPALPHDAGAPEAQYWYAAHAESYKLIVHGVGDLCSSEVQQQGVRIDPARTGEDGSCWAYGFWTDDMSGV